MRLHEEFKEFIVISHMIKGRRHFVTRSFTPCESGKKHVVNLTTKPEEAMRFEHRGLALDFIVKIKNPGVFVWDTVTIKVQVPRVIVIKPVAREVLQTMLV